jgi:hypothetical protein
VLTHPSFLGLSAVDSIVNGLKSLGGASDDGAKWPLCDDGIVNKDHTWGGVGQSETVALGRFKRSL